MWNECQTGVPRCRRSLFSSIAACGVSFAAAFSVAPAALAAAEFHALPNAETLCPADLDQNGAIDLGDLMLTLDAWGASAAGGRADLDQSQNVDVMDLVIVLSAWGPCHFDYGAAINPAVSRDAVLLGLSALGPADARMVADRDAIRLQRDMDQIRDSFVDLIDVHPDTAVDVRTLQVRIDPDATEDALAEFHALNAYYNAIATPRMGVYFTVEFPHAINVHAVSVAYADTSSVLSADVVTLGPQCNAWTFQRVEHGTIRYTIDDGFLDSGDGCDCHRIWTIDVTSAGDIIPISYVEAGAPWCDF